MRKLMMILVVLALLMAFPAVAGAKRPPSEGLTCAKAYGESRFVDTRLWAGNGDLSFTLTPGAGMICIDLTNQSQMKIEVAATNHGDATKGFVFLVRDSHPGDICESSYHWTAFADGDTDRFSFDVPVAAVNACGTEFNDGADSLVFMLSADFKSNAKKGSSIDVVIKGMDPSLSS